MKQAASSPTLEQRLAARDPGDRQPVMFQSWRHLLFLHWKVDPQSIQAMLPAGLTLDLHEGEAYVGVVPFFMCDVRPRFLPCAPYLSNFLELNVRTYVHDAAGIPGVWFFSLDANCAPAVWLAQTLFQLPYRHAKMSAEISEEGWIDYSSNCRAGDYDGEFRYRREGAADEAEPGSLDFFLLERYYLYAHSQKRERLLRGQVAHAPYRSSTAWVPKFSAEPMTQQGILPAAGDAGADFDHACVSARVDVKILGLEVVRV